MAITEKEYNELQKDAKGYLEINTNDFYFNKFRPFVQEMLLKCRTDQELIRTLEKTINAADSFCIAKKYTELQDSLYTLDVAINDRNYFNGVMKKAPEAEKEMVRKLIEKISDLKMIIKCEPPHEEKEVKTRERLNYEKSEFSPIGENKDYYSRNMKTLNKPIQKTRIPNR